MKNNKFAALVELYSREITNSLEPIYQNREMGKNFVELLPLNRINELADECLNATDFSRKLFVEIRESPLSKADNERLYKDVMSFLQANQPQSTLHKVLKCSDRNTIMSEFSYVLNNLDGFIRYIDPNTVLSYLDSYAQYKTFVPDLRREIHRNQSYAADQEEFKKKLILRTVPMLGEYAVYDIMYAVCELPSNNSASEAKEFIEKILNLKKGAFPMFYGSVCADRIMCRGRIYVCPIHENATEMLVNIGTPAFNENKFRTMNIRWESIQDAESVPRKVYDSLQEKLNLQRTLCLRNYQDELCRVALRDENTIVAAPTGSGKTVIAAKIIKNHFEIREKSGKRFKGLFMTPNSLILKQQADNISSYLGNAYQVQVVQGAVNIPLRNAIQSKDLILATPQIIVNLCNEHRDELIKDQMSIEKFFLSTFTIIFFDECHNTLKKTPYANIMREYHALKNLGNMPDGHNLPQIVGLAASLGTGDAKNVSEACVHIANICATLDVKKLSVVKENLDELRQYSPIVPDTVCYCPRSDDKAIGEFVKWMKFIMQEIEVTIKTALDEEHICIQAPSEDSENVPDTIFTSAPLDKEHSRYLNWVCNEKNIVSVTKFKNNRTKLVISEALELLKECYLTLTYSINFNPEVALKYLKNELDIRSINFTPEMKRIWEYHHRLINSGKEENPMITKVEEYLVDQYRRRENFRAIIFVKTRYEATILSDILNKNDKLKGLGISSDCILGGNKSAYIGAETVVSKLKQMEKLKRFASGEVCVLVSTSIAEEGLDVAECSLVVSYNYATNEIARIQRKGRGRAGGSTCVLITNSLALGNQESENRDKEMMMEQALALIEKQPGNFQQLLETEAGKVWARIQKEDAESAQRVAELVDKNITYNIVCKKCEVFLCTNHDIRARNTQYLVCRPEFWSAVEKIKLTAAESEKERYAAGKVICRGSHCGASLGKLIEVSTVDLPCIAANAILLITQGSNEKRISVKKWKQIISKYFTPSPIRQLDVQIMKDADHARTPINFELIEGTILQEGMSSAVAPIFGVLGSCMGCMVFVENIAKKEPSAMNLMTFSTFFFISTVGLISTSKFFTVKNKIPLEGYYKTVSMFFIVNVVNNQALNFHVPVPLHIIFRSGSLLATLVLSVLLVGKKYSARKYISVFAITVGIVICTLATSSQGDSDLSMEEATKHYKDWSIGIAMLTFALLASAYLAICQQQMYEKYGKHPDEAMFVTHFVSLPFFLIMGSDIASAASIFTASAPYSLIPWLPSLWVDLLASCVLQYGCIKYVYQLNSRVDSLTVTLVVTLRKFLSLIVSIVYFKNPFTLQHWIGAALVFAGTLAFADIWGGQTLKKADEKKKQ